MLSFVPPQPGQVQGAGWLTVSRGRCSGSRCRPPARAGFGDGSPAGVRPGRARDLGQGLALLELADQQLELLDGLVELLRRAAEPGPAQHRQLGLELLDMQGLGVDLGVAGGNRQILLRELGLQSGRERPQRVGIGGQVLARQRHASC